MFLLHLIILLNAVFNCSKSLLSSSVDTVTAETYIFVSVTLNITPAGASVADLAGLSSCGSTAACVQSKHNFQTMLKLDLLRN